MRYIIVRFAVWLLVFALGGCSSVFAQDAPYQVKIEFLHNILAGLHTKVVVTLEQVDTARGLASFDLVLKYDTAAINLEGGRPGSGVWDCHWSNFTYQPDPDGTIRITGLADNGNHNMTCLSPVYGVGPLPMVLCTLFFQTSSDQCFADCQFSPIRWYWAGCGDNVITGQDSTELLISNQVLTQNHPQLLDITDSTIGYPTYQGAQADCPPVVGRTVIRELDLIGGGLDFVCSDSAGLWRGDINLDNWSYQSGDIDMLHQYFLVGTSAFPIAPQVSTVASDLTADGRELELGDLIYGNLILIGAVAPFSSCISVQPWDAMGTADFLQTNGDLSLSTDLVLGGVWLLVDRHVTAVSLDTGMTLEWQYDGDVTRILVTGTKRFHPASIESGQLLTLHPFEEIDADFEIIDLQACDTLGKFVEAGLQVVTHVDEPGGGVLPGAFQLFQNTPNPFNPETHIDFEIPAACSPVFEVFNASGQLVKRLSLGYREPGHHEVIWRADDNGGNPVASGIYLYRLTAGDYTATRKAVLLK